MPSFDADHWFWWLLTAAVLVWYSTITAYVAFKGSFDVKHMLARLKEDHVPTTEAAPPAFDVLPPKPKE